MEPPLIYVFSHAISLFGFAACKLWPLRVRFLFVRLLAASSLVGLRFIVLAALDVVWQFARYMGDRVLYLLSDVRAEIDSNVHDIICGVIPKGNTRPFPKVHNYARKCC